MEESGSRVQRQVELSTLHRRYRWQARRMQITEQQRKLVLQLQEAFQHRFDGYL